MYGQTNCWISPDISYIVFRSIQQGDEILISTRRAARNMSYQGFTHREGEVILVANSIGYTAQLIIGKLLSFRPSDPINYSITVNTNTALMTLCPPKTPLSKLTTLCIRKSVLCGDL